MTGVVLIIIIFVISMFIAYLGDILGKRIGKKRISILNLRPKYTAIVVTVITGGVISLATFGLLIASSGQMRQMLLKTEEMQQEIADLTETRNELRENVRQLNESVSSIADQLQTTSNERDQAVEERELVKAEADEYRDDIATLSVAIGEKQSQLDELEKSSTELETKIDDLTLRLTTAQTELDNLNDELESTIEEKEFVGSQIVLMNKDLNNLEEEKLEKEKQISNLSTTISDLNARIYRIKTETIAFHKGQRLYAFTIKNDQLYVMLPLIKKTFEDFNNGDPVWTKNCTIEEPSADDLLEVIEKIQGSHAEESIVLVFAKRNSFPNDKIPIEFEVLDQYVVFRSDSLIVDEIITRKLNLFEARDLANKLIHEALIKAHNRGLLRNPYGEVARFAPETLNHVAEQIVEHDLPVKITMVTKTEISRGDYLDESNLEFRITDA